MALGPQAISALGLGPAFGESLYEAGIPVSEIIATVNDDAVSVATRLGGIAFDIADRHAGVPPEINRDGVQSRLKTGKVYGVE